MLKKVAFILPLVSVLTVPGRLSAQSTALLTGTMTSEDIEELPLVNRDAYSLLNLAAGVDFTGQATDNFGAPQQQTYVNGSPNSSVGFSICVYLRPSMTFSAACA